MENFVELMNLAIDFMKTKFSIYGFEISYWDVMIVALLGGIIFDFVRRMIDG